ncbi:External alternative NADH-ubiquinone oxidoreductase [Fusarium oxysporum f. sp. albedinis]|nr:External alternative NADH-ubiquinone oxidoreductase [Fusarium oxysporum f. sp. albedinis]
MGELLVTVSRHKEPPAPFADFDNVSLHNYPYALHENGTTHLASFVHPNGVENGAIQLNSLTTHLGSPCGFVSASHRQWQLRDMQIRP